jgi:hypothetical protein
MGFRSSCFISCKSLDSCGVNSRFSNKSGRRARVRCSDCFNRHSAIRAWLPERNTSGNRHALKFDRAGVVRDSRASRRQTNLARPTGHIAQYAGQQPQYGIHQHHGGQFAAGNHKVANGRFLHRCALQARARLCLRSGRTAKSGYRVASQLCRPRHDGERGALRAEVNQFCCRAIGLGLFDGCLQRRCGIIIMPGPPPNGLIIDIPQVCCRQSGVGLWR